MDNSNRLFWLASYPKSGNTWFRIVLANVLSKVEEAVNINSINTGGIASSRVRLENYYGVDAGLFTLEEQNLLRPALYANWFEQHHGLQRFHKVHDSFSRLESGAALFGDCEQQAAIYIVRNPLDVIVSYAKHSGVDEYDRIIKGVNDSRQCIGNINNKYNLQLPQLLGSWSDHVISWLDSAPMPVYLVKYEDLLQQPFNTFCGALEFAGVEFTKAKLLSAIESSEFSKLQLQEEQLGFRERPLESKKFFRSGGVSNYQKVLSKGQVEKVLTIHQQVMKRLGYYDDCCAWLEKEKSAINQDG